MIHITFPEPTTEQWRTWRLRAETATKDLITRAAAGEPITSKDIKDVIYKGARVYFYEAFHQKCAYCEAKFVLDQSGDVDHYRPKGDVTDQFDRPVQKGGARHPGYYWLAYDWRNLLPCCAKCNRPSRLASGKIIGKGTRFPVDKDEYAFDPAGVEQEVPMFLNPLLDNPTEHLMLDTETGVIAGTDSRGVMTVGCLGSIERGCQRNVTRFIISP